MVARGVTPTHEHLRSRLVFLFVATIILDAVASVIVFLLERNGTARRSRTSEIPSSGRAHSF